MSLKETYCYFIKYLVISTLVCPHCKAKGLMKIHGYYNRHVVSWNGNHLIDEVLRILRIKCESCGTTHAVLPDFIIPYCTYSYNLILECLKSYFDKQKVLDLCEKYCISHQVLYSWIKRLEAHGKQCKLFFELKETELNKRILIKIVSKIFEYQLLSDFLMKYFIENKFCFMQIIKPPG